MISGIVLIDKPADLTSGEVVRRVKKILGVKKAGHSGTLDSKATGVLLIAINEATKAMPFFAKLSKEYIGKITLHKDVDKEKILNATSKFVGKIRQVPPKKSAVKRVERTRTVYSFEIKRIEGRLVSFKIKCEAGTYIRKIAYDFGRYLGCGAHLSELRRVKIGDFSENESVGLEELNRTHVILLEKALGRINIKKVYVKYLAIKKIRNGIPLLIDDIEKYDESIKINELIGVYLKNKIIAIGIAVQSFDNIDKRKLLIKIKRVFKTND